MSIAERGGVARRPLPEGWRWVALSDVGEFAAGGTPSKNNSTFWGGDVPFVTGADITAFDITGRNCRAYLTKAGLLSGKTAYCPPGTVLIVSRTRVGRVGIARETVGASQDITSFHCGPDLQPDYLGLFIRSISRWLISQARGATILGLTRDTLVSLSLPLPPLPEQRRITAMLIEQMEAVEKARAAFEEQLGAAKAFPGAYLRAVFENEEAKQWPRRRLGDLVRLRHEVMHPHDNPSGQAIFVGLEHIEPGTGARIGSMAVEMSQLIGRKPRFYRRDIVYGYLRPYLNKVWVAEFDGLCSVDQYVLQVKDGVAPEFLAAFMLSPTFLSRAPVGITPGQLPRIRIEELLAVEVNVPQPEVQDAIGHHLRQTVAMVNSLVQTVLEQARHLEHLAASLHRRAFEGGL